MEKNRQYHTSLSRGDIGRYVLLPGDPGRTPLIAKHFDSAKEIVFNREYRTFTGHITGHDGKRIKISTTSTGIGCPSAAIAVEELIKIGADTLIRIGTAGSIQKKIALGDIVISTASVREEGTTRQYVPLSYPAVASLEITSALIEAARRLNIKAHSGISQCKDAFYSEIPKDVPLSEYNEQMWNVWRRSNVLASAMESSALFVISSIRNVRAGEILTVVGKLDAGKLKLSKISSEDAIRIAVEAVRILEEKRNKRK